LPETGVPPILFEQSFETISEDEVTLEAQQQRISEDPDRGFVGIASDRADNQTRRLLSAMRDAQTARPLLLSSVGA